MDRFDEHAEFIIAFEQEKLAACRAGAGRCLNDDAHFDWVTEGIAGFVRYRSGFTSLADRRPGGSPNEDWKTTGFFFDWLDRMYPDAVYRLNQSLDPDDQRAWSERVFMEISGRDLATLWNDYQRSL